MLTNILKNSQLGRDVKTIKPILIEEVEKIPECEFRNYLGFKCDQPEITPSKEDGILETWHWDEEFKKSILDEMGEFPEEDFLKLKQENEELDKQLLKNSQTN